jgi:hypothetical protein
MNVRKKQKRGMLWVDRVGDRRSYAILAQKFSLKNGGEAQNKKTRALGYRPPRGLEPSLPVASRGRRGAVA